MQELSEAEYLRLQEHASQSADFVYLGSIGEGKGRGTLRGFSALALEQLRVDESPKRGSAVDHISQAMQSRMDEFRLSSGDGEEHLTGGWYGVIGYEFGLHREPRLRGSANNTPFPLIHAGFYLWAASYNERTGRHFLWIHPQCSTETRQTLLRWLEVPPGDNPPAWSVTRPFRATQSKPQFKAGVGSILRYINAGDCYQANLSQEFVGQSSGDPWHGFKALAEEHPTPFSAFLRVNGGAVLSLSPERFLEIERGTITTSPIKGTRPRGDTPEQDNAYAEELQASEKDRAENLMIVDLLRNDLGQNAVPGSVKVDRLFALESYRNVHHLVSHIRAELRDGISPIKALMDAFPGGSITGAPKIRSMEIINELEPHWRGPYCGSVFYWGLNGRLDSNIAIRTLLCEEDGTIRCWGGGGIVADSDPESEYQETLTKVKPLMDFLETLHA
ncbi:aminodeoxychorismate synthase component I [Marinobacter sp. F4216]|nr:aminodeoxychorismate synthase component I [Marinobacter sp. F4216]